jgi:hypothetical protein
MGHKDLSDNTVDLQIFPSVLKIQLKNREFDEESDSKSYFY